MDCFKASRHHLHREDDGTVNICSGRKSNRWYPTYVKQYRQLPFRNVRSSERTRCFASDFDVVGNSLSVSDADRSDEIPYSRQGLLYCCSSWVFVYILWCGDFENNLAIVSHYLQEVLNELISEGQRLFFLRCHEFPSFFYVLLLQWWYKGCRLFRRNLFFFSSVERSISHILH